MLSSSLHADVGKLASQIIEPEDFRSDKVQDAISAAHPLVNPLTRPKRSRVNEVRQMDYSIR